MEAFAGTEIENVREGRKIVIGEGFQINRLWTILSDETVGVFIGAASPRRMGRRKIEG